MDHLIGLKLEDAIKELNNKGISFKIVSNNHNVEGDTVLVTNATQLQDKTIVLTVGSFIFKLKD